MTQWYYADASGQRHGPFSAEELESHVRHARLGAASLVWREGLQDWQPLGAVATELNLQLDAIATPDVDVAVPAADAPYTPPTADLASFQTIVAGHLVHAGLWKRFAASFIDSIVTTVISYALMIPLMLIGIALYRMGFFSGGFERAAMIASGDEGAFETIFFGLRQSLDTVGAFLGPLLAIVLMWAFANDFQSVFWVAVIPAFTGMTNGINLRRRSAPSARRARR